MMKLKYMSASLMGLTMSSIICAQSTSSAPLKTEADKLSYSIGADLGKNLKKNDVSINPNALLEGLNDGMNHKKLRLDDKQRREVLTAFQKKLTEKRTAQFTKLAKENKAKGEKFLKENKKKKGVVTLPSGLQYKILKDGNGVKPTKNDLVTVEYTGYLLNGKVFDSTDKAGKPATFKPTQVIPGWTEALQLMQVGSEWEVYVPANLAYGSRNVGNLIGPNETLIFKINLLAVKNK